MARPKEASCGMKWFRRSPYKKLNQDELAEMIKTLAFEIAKLRGQKWGKLLDNEWYTYDVINRIVKKPLP